MSNDIDLVCERLERLELTLRSLVASGSDNPASHEQGTSTELARAGQPVHRPVHVKEVTMLPAAQPGRNAGAITKQTTLAAVEAIIDARKSRLKFFDTDFFFDPVWAMIIDLYRAELKGERLSVSSVCYGSGVAQTTALRYVAMLEERGYVERYPDESDKRRAFLRLTPAARDRLANYFGHLAKHGVTDFRLVA